MDNLNKIWKQKSASPVQSSLILLMCRMTDKLVNILEIIEGKGEDWVLNKVRTRAYGKFLNRKMTLSEQQLGSTANETRSGLNVNTKIQT